MLEEYENINNIALIRNNLRHINAELDSTKPSPMRIAKECHQLFSRMMVEALRGTSNTPILGRPQKNRKYWYTKENDPWMVMQKEKIEGCCRAWRYSEPVPETPPCYHEQRPSKTERDDFLFGFYDLLAMIQAPCFMHRYVHSEVVSVSDKEMHLLEWLHEEIRNDFEHFMPKKLLVFSDDCLCATGLCLRLAMDLLTKSNNVNVLLVGLEGLPVELSSTLASLSTRTEWIPEKSTDFDR